MNNLNGSFTYKDTEYRDKQFDRGKIESASNVISSARRKGIRKVTNQKSKKGTSVIDLVATPNFWQEEDDHTATDIKSDKVVMTPIGVTANALVKALHPNTKIE